MNVLKSWFQPSAGKRQKRSGLGLWWGVQSRQGSSLRGSNEPEA
jgi:hypothetical protein